MYFLIAVTLIYSSSYFPKRWFRTSCSVGTIHIKSIITANQKILAVYLLMMIFYCG